VGLGADGKFNIYSYTGVDFIVDVTGYYAPPGAGGLYYHALSAPVRLLDTRVGEPGAAGCDRPNQQIAANTYHTETSTTLLACAAIPATAKGVVGNATVVNSSPSSGFVSLQPGAGPVGSSPPP